MAIPKEKASANRCIERRAIRLSSVGYVAMGVTGLVFAVLTHSGAIMLDGVYSLISFVMTLFAGRVAKLVEQPDSENFQFGYAYFEPLLNTIRGLLILALVTFGVGSAVAALFTGGRDLKPGPALGYSVIVGTICVVLSLVQRRHARQTASPLLEVDARNWLIDGMLTVAVGVAFLVALGLSFTAWAGWIPYVDPAVVVVLGLGMAVTPISIVWTNVGELLHVAPDETIQEEVRRRFEQATDGLALRERDVRMVKVGRYFYVLGILVVEEAFDASDVGDLDHIREKIAAALIGCHPRLVLDVAFTKDRRLILGLVEEGSP